MSGFLVILVGMIYSYVAVEQYIQGNPAMCIVYAGYAFSNIGLYLTLK